MHQYLIYFEIEGTLKWDAIDANDLIHACQIIVKRYNIPQSGLKSAHILT